MLEQNGKKSDLKMLKNLMFVQNVPMTLKDLAVDGNDLKEHFPEISKNKYSTILNHLLTVCCIAPELNNKKLLFEIISKNK